MKNQSLIAHAILAECWEQLLKHARGNWMELNPNPWIDEGHRSITTIANMGPDYIEHTIPQTKEILLKWINEYLTESKIVILYTCGDNACISLDNPKDFTEDFDILEAPAFSKLHHILYMAYD